ncbi:hypothetical protein SeLEV6574_g03950 [Synchytrium endobioticum]|uniref:Uncharacterized protein n=1 Tax=Synchytrium endobioticum TaxID=286115 RepID=A0A507D202_9FUNG|nr:hypothetical protein SeLEV6574_g03950 [Synchytrium endobioticum]
MTATAIPTPQGTITGSQGGAGGGIGTGQGGTVTGSQGGPGGNVGISSVDDSYGPPRNFYYPYYPAGFNQATGQRLNPQGRASRGA